MKKRSFYLSIPHADFYARIGILTQLYHYLPNLPKFLMASEVGEHLSFVRDPDEIDAAIETFWDLKRLWCGQERQDIASTHKETKIDESILS